MPLKSYIFLAVFLLSPQLGLAGTTDTLFPQSQWREEQKSPEERLKEKCRNYVSGSLFQDPECERAKAQGLLGSSLSTENFGGSALALLANSLVSGNPSSSDSYHIRISGFLHSTRYSGEGSGKLEKAFNDFGGARISYGIEASLLWPLGASPNFLAGGSVISISEDLKKEMALIKAGLSLNHLIFGPAVQYQIPWNFTPRIHFRLVGGPSVYLWQETQESEEKKWTRSASSSFGWAWIASAGVSVFQNSDSNFVFLEYSLLGTTPHKSDIGEIVTKSHLFSLGFQF